MLKLFGLVLSAVSLSVSRVPVMRVVLWKATPYGGYVYETDLNESNDSNPVNITYTNGGYWNGTSVVYFVDTLRDTHTDFKTRTWSSTDFTQSGDKVLLLAFAWGSTNLSALVYDTANGGYQFSTADINAIPDGTPAGTYATATTIVLNKSTGVINYRSNSLMTCVHINYTLINAQTLEVNQYSYYQYFINYSNDVTDVDIALPDYEQGDYCFLSVDYLPFDDSQNMYAQGWNAGYDAGYTSGNQAGETSGYQTGYATGYATGVSDANVTFSSLLFTVADTPVYFLKSLFNFELFGVKVYIALLSMLTIMVVTWVVKKVV